MSPGTGLPRTVHETYAIHQSSLPFTFPEHSRAVLSGSLAVVCGQERSSARFLSGGTVFNVKNLIVSLRPHEELLFVLLPCWAATYEMANDLLARVPDKF